ncbi:MAG: Fe-S cluster assembly ATPase SufC [Candidatus Micrarchaeaceae archaeon]
MQLDIVDLHVSAENKEILKGVSLSVRSGEFHVVMGPNGSGKTTLSLAIMGYPGLKVTQGDIRVDNESILGKRVDERAKLGIFVQFQDPAEIEGVGLVNFLSSAKAAVSSSKFSVRELMSEIRESAATLKMREDIVGRSVNFGFSGGEKKKSEILQMLVLKPKLAILDEPDSGLDVDAVKDVASAISSFSKGTGAATILITHYTRILKYLEPDFVHVIIDGKIAKSGSKELADYVDKNGYKF